jgi:hypothetical protein
MRADARPEIRRTTSGLIAPRNWWGWVGGGGGVMMNSLIGLKELDFPKIEALVKKAFCSKQILLCIEFVLMMLCSI